MLFWCLAVFILYTMNCYNSVKRNFSAHIYTIELGGAGGNPLLSRRFATEGSTEASSPLLSVGG